MRISRCIVAFGAAALLSTQAAYGSVKSAPAIDPLVALSVFGTAQSRAAVCAAGAHAAVAGSAVAAAQNAANPNCLLPLSDAPPPVAAPVPPPAPVPVPPPPPPGKSIGTLPILLGLVAIAALAAVLLIDDNDGGDPEPISP